MAGLGRERSPRQLIQWSADVGFRGIALDGTAQGMRSRELGRSARRELAALLRRSELGFAGVDLWIPPSHLLEGEHQDRAVSATLGAISLAGEIGRLNGDSHPVVSMTLPSDGDAEPMGQIFSAATAEGVTIADHQWPSMERSDSAEASHAIGVGIDPATILLAGDDPVEQLLMHNPRIACLRLSDADQAGRTVLGSGRLDVQAYSSALRAGGFAMLALVDVRGLAEPMVAAAEAKERIVGAS